MMKRDVVVLAVSSSPTHTFSKPSQDTIKLIEGFGVEGDAHGGERIKHRFLAKKDAQRPNLRQVHLIHSELFDELEKRGFSVKPGELGENITTKGVDLLSLPTGTKLFIGSEVIVELTALRNPCVQIDDFQKGLLKAVLGRDKDGNLIRKAGVMGVVLAGGVIKAGDVIKLEMPAKPYFPLEYVW